MSRRPDFLIIGAMKAGTTSLHHALAAHPDVFIPGRELFFFDADDFVEHGESFRTAEGGWRHLDFEADRAELEAAWLEAFEPAGDAGLVGEDSTTYLTSPLAPARVARELPDVRVVLTLRDPVDRAWSHYWHLVRSGRMSLRFEDALLAGPGTLLHRSRYAQALARWLEHVPRERVHVVVFEHFVAEPQAVLDGLQDFLGLPRHLRYEELSAQDQHRHKGRVPRSPSLQRAANWMRRQPVLGQDVPPVAPPTRKQGAPWLAKGLEKLAGTEAVAGTPPMREDTRDLLRHVLGRDNQGLAELIGRPLTPWWPWFPA